GKADGGGGESCDVGNSFVPGTKVLMADGSSKPIEEVEVGDKVVATDPETGETRIETVTAEIKGKGLKHLVKVVIDTDGDKGEKTAEVTATDGHPFWVPELGQWLDATDLQPGQWLQTSAGTHVQITAIERWTTPGTTVHNLTVGDTHTYYVLAGAAPVLVHNTGCPTSYALSLKTGGPKGSGANQAYQIRQVGSTEYHATGGGTQVWADGLDINTSELLDAKYVGKPGRSPYVPGGKVPEFIQAQVDEKMNDEFARYAAVINDPRNPLKGLRVITNEPGAVPYFRGLMQQHGIPGSVVLSP
ncbi:polymorphic toxin-type HINT domain-containing protein, partial [Streptomyces sp. ECR3.8]|uniref:polymorphic toxin-type HINT domain-containing protein n=1 Tax=Streptomyces sp. ECR3.8 TaxID=3461009 RepID=UPI00404231AB